jgi:DNA topoisomerase-1
LIKRRYVTSNKGVLTPSDDGKKTIAVLQKYFPDIVDTSYTAAMENKLDKVESGDETFLQAMNEFYVPFNETFEKARELMWKEPDQETGELCPVCGRPLVVKKNRKGQTFIGCSGYKTRACTYIKKDPKPEPTFTGDACPDCGSPLLIKISKKGEKFIGCSNFPKCKYIEPEKPKETGELCPECGHPLVEKKSKRGTTFIGCSNFPQCNYIKPDEKKKAVVVRKKTTVTEADWVKPCPKCGKGHLIVRHSAKGDFLGCTNFPRCRYTEDPNKGEKK